ncbi:MAG: alpha-L-fucosidase [Opitutaceae bacterium]
MKIIHIATALAMLPAAFGADAPMPAAAPAGSAAAAPAAVGGAAYAAVPRNSNGIFIHEGGAGLPAYPVIVRDETPAARDARMKWFREARFGIFIHWGVYSSLAGSWKGRPAGAEWIMNTARIPVADYRAQARSFTASKYEPQTWAQLFQDAGARYVVITAKHHDGCALYDSAYSDWNVVKASGAGRDLLQPLADAVRARGLKFGLYYSQSQDWVNPGGGKGRVQPWDDAQKGDFDEYLAKVSLPQVREILEKYHPAYLFFDTEYQMTPERARPFFDLVASHPDLISNNRLGGGVLGDVGTPEQRIATDPLGRQFEVCMTINGSLGYNSSDLRWKSARQLIRNLSDISGKGGNYLLNVGPTAEGVIPQPEIDRLLAMGRWLKTNGEAVYATEAGPLPQTSDWGRTTQRTHPDGGATLYLHVWNWPADGRILLTGVRQTVLSGRLLANGAGVTAEATEAGLVVTLPGDAPDPDVSVAALELAGPVLAPAMAELNRRR